MKFDNNDPLHKQIHFFNKTRLEFYKSCNTYLIANGFKRVGEPIQRDSSGH